MPTTRAQEAAEKHNMGDRKSPEENTLPALIPQSKSSEEATSSQNSTSAKQEEEPAVVGEKRDAATSGMGDEEDDPPPTKQAKVEDTEEAEEIEQMPLAGSMYEEGTIERGHIYFFYRPKIELEEAQSLEDVQRFYMVLVPSPPQFASAPDKPLAQAEGDEEQEMNLIEPGADVVPTEEPGNKSKKRFRVIVVGKKALPDPEAGGGGKGGGRKQVFWASVSTVGEDLKKLEEGLGGSTYETMTRGTRHQGPARLVARGAYAIVNKESKLRSQRETHLGYYISHPSREQFGDVQRTLGLHQASSFILQIKNPLAPPTGAAQVGLPKYRRADYPEDILRGVFGLGGWRGREAYGLRFASCERSELLDYEGAELLFIASRSGEEGLEQSLGEGRGQALGEVERRESKETMDQVIKELAIDATKIPVNPLEGEWE